MASSTKEHGSAMGVLDRRLPVELLLYIVELRAAEGEAGLHRDIASLRLASKLLCQIATPFFYTVIELSSSAHSKVLLDQLRAGPAQSKLTHRTRAIWWGELPNDASDKVAFEAAATYSVKFPNVEDVAFYFTPLSQDQGGTKSFIGCHYALREVGPWCEPLRFLRPAWPVTRMQHMPTTAGLYKTSLRGSLAHTMRTRLLEASWMQRHEGVTVPAGKPAPWQREAQLKRASWACHLVGTIADLTSERKLFQMPRTITHLTLTLCRGKNDEDYEHVLEVLFDSILQAERMSMLRSFSARIIRSDKNFRVSSRMPPGCRFKETSFDRQFASAEWRRAEAVKQALEECGDSRSRCEEVYNPVCEDFNWSIPPPRVKDTVRKYTLEQWRARAYPGRSHWDVWHRDDDESSEEFDSD